MRREVLRRPTRPDPTATELCPPGQMLVPRSRTAQYIGRSVSTVIRLENQGILSKVRLTKTGAVLHRIEEVYALRARCE